MLLDAFARRSAKQLSPLKQASATRILNAIKSTSPFNCLSKTNLYLIVPSLNSKTRGNVFHNFNLTNPFFNLVVYSVEVVGLGYVSVVHTMLLVGLYHVYIELC